MKINIKSEKLEKRSR